MIHGPVGSRKAARAGAGIGMARFAGQGSLDVVGRHGGLALDRRLAYRGIPRSQMARRAIRGIAICRMVHRPGRESTNGPHTRRGRGMTCFTGKRGRNVIGDFTQHSGRNRRTRIATVVATCTTRCNSFMVHRGIGYHEAFGVYTRWRGVAHITFLRGRNMVR